MERKFSNPALFAIAIIALQLSGCGGFSLWPFGSSDDKASIDVTKPANSTEYLCEANKKFYVRNIDKGETAWLILQDREVGLPKVSATRFSNSITTLDLAGDATTLEINATTTYKGCKATNPGKP